MDRFIELYGWSFLEGFFITLFLLMILLFLGRFLPLPKRPFVKELPRAGGIALFCGFMATVFTLPFLALPPEWLVFFGILFLFVVVGILDDYKSLPWYVQLGVQVAVLMGLYVGGIHIFSLTHPMGGIWVVPNEGLLSLGAFLFVLWGITVINTLNWLDGIDGLCGSMAFIVYSSFFILALGDIVNQPPIAILSAALMGSTLAFLVYNFPRAKVFAGTSGVFFFGLTITFLSVIAGTKIATALLVLTLPFLDAGFVILKRFLRGVSLTARDTTHLHHILVERGWSPQRIIFLYGGLTLVIAIVALNTSMVGKLLAISTSFILIGSLLFHFHFPSGKFRRWAFGFAAIALFLVATVFFTRDATPRQVLLGEKLFRVEIVDTEEERALGLSGREALCAECAMLFIFDAPGTHYFWMKDMQFSIDIIWLDEQRRVIYKAESLPFPSLVTVGPDNDSAFVLEVPAGSAAAVQIGDSVSFLP